MVLMGLLMGMEEHEMRLLLSSVIDSINISL